MNLASSEARFTNPMILSLLFEKECCPYNDVNTMYFIDFKK